MMMPPTAASSTIAAATIAMIIMGSSSAVHPGSRGRRPPWLERVSTWLAEADIHQEAAGAHSHRC